jgi:hypothetical protein
MPDAWGQGEQGVGNACGGLSCVIDQSGTGYGAQP